MSQHNDVVVRDVENGRTGWDGCSGETLLAPCTRKKRLQRKMTKYYHWIGVQENIGIFSKSQSDCKGGFPLIAEITRRQFLQ